MEKEYEVKGGSLTVRAFRADRDSEVPLIEVTGETLYRGKTYTIQELLRRGHRYLKGTPLGEGWVSSGIQTYRGGFRLKATGVQVPYPSATDKDLDKLVCGVADAFVSDFPDWRSESVRLRRAALVSNADAEVSRLEMLLNEAVAAAAALRSKYGMS